MDTSHPGALQAVHLQPEGLVFPHPEIRQRVPEPAQLEGRDTART